MPNIKKYLGGKIYGVQECSCNCHVPPGGNRRICDDCKCEHPEEVDRLFDKELIEQSLQDEGFTKYHIDQHLKTVKEEPKENYFQFKDRKSNIRKDIYDKFHDVAARTDEAQDDYYQDQLRKTQQNSLDKAKLEELQNKIEVDLLGKRKNLADQQVTKDKAKLELIKQQVERIVDPLQEDIRGFNYIVKKTRYLIDDGDNDDIVDPEESDITLNKGSFFSLYTYFRKTIEKFDSYHRELFEYRNALTGDRFELYTIEGLQETKTEIERLLDRLEKMQKIYQMYHENYNKLYTQWLPDCLAFKKKNKFDFNPGYLYVNYQIYYVIRFGKLLTRLARHNITLERLNSNKRNNLRTKFEEFISLDSEDMDNRIMSNLDEENRKLCNFFITISGMFSFTDDEKKKYDEFDSESLEVKDRYLLILIYKMYNECQIDFVLDKAKFELKRGFKFELKNLILNSSLPIKFIREGEDEGNNVELIELHKEYLTTPPDLKSLIDAFDISRGFVDYNGEFLGTEDVYNLFYCSILIAPHVYLKEIKGIDCVKSSNLVHLITEIEDNINKVKYALMAQ